MDVLLSGGCKQRPFLGNGSVNTSTLLGSRFSIMPPLDYNKRDRVFLRVPCRDVISKGQNQLRVQLSSARKAVKKEHEGSPLLEVDIR
jgi:hypothetical protein